MRSLTLNLGILAHVDAGKTSLTERLLHAAGVIDEIGRVDDGSTQTDSLALERRRGITIRSAVVAFTLPGSDLTVDLIDTPGHPDFIAEVERVLGVLDGAVLVVSAVEGVQAQTRVLFRALRRLGVPTLLFVNKVDRAGADPARVEDEIRAKLTPAAVPLTATTAPGTKHAAVARLDRRDPAVRDRLTAALAEHDDDLLAAYVEGRPVTGDRLHRTLARLTAATAIHPVLHGSAVTGAGVAELVDGLATLLPSSTGDPDAPAEGTVFKVERGPAGEPVAYARMYAGTVRTRDRLPMADGTEARVTGVGVFRDGGVERRDAVTAGQIAQLHGLAGVRIGDPVGRAHDGAVVPAFAPPTLESVVVPDRASDKGAVYAALTQLAEQDPLIDLRQDDARDELYVSLYGEVQKEVVQATLAEEYGLAVTFRETTTICVERVAGTGEALDVIATGDNPYLATVGLRIAPAPAGAGLRYGMDVELGSMPSAFHHAVEETVRATLRQGLRGWPVPDATVTLTRNGYWARQSHAHGTFDKNMSTMAADFRYLTPLVLMAALREAGTVVHEPAHRFTLTLPADTLGPVLPVLAKLGAVPEAPVQRGAEYELAGEIPAARVHELTRLLPGLTRGEGVVETAFSRYVPVTGVVPVRARSGPDPLNRRVWFLQVTR